MNNKYYAVVTPNSDDALAHYGVKGMRWGVRKAYEYVRKHSASRRKIGTTLPQTVQSRNKAYEYAKKYAGKGAAIGSGLTQIAYSRAHAKNYATKYGKDKAYTAKIDKRVAKAKAYLNKKHQKVNRKYSKDQMAKDYVLYGKRGVKRINKQLNKGKSMQRATIKEFSKATSRASSIANIVANRKEIINGAKKVANLGYNYYKYKTQNGGRIGIEQNPYRGKAVYDTTYREVSSKRKKKK